MNTYKIGRDFEIEALVYLKEKFNNAVWLSKNRYSLFDFACEDKDGEVYYGDAKVVSRGCNPRLTYGQRTADFVIVKKKNEIIFIWKSDFKNKVSIDKGNTGLVRISEETKKLLDRNKIHSKETYTEVLWRLMGHE